MSETYEKTTKTTVVRRMAINGHHLVVADILSFADELRKAGIPPKEMVNIEISPETLHSTGLRVHWHQDV
jgi:hypothetical protein